MNQLNIRKAGIDDLAQLQQISKETFFETFATSNTEENMQHYLETRLSLERLSMELLNPGSTFYFAVIDGRVVGYLKLNTGNAQTEVQNDHSLEIERIYVLNEFHGLKIGQQLVEKAMEIAHETKMNDIWLGVWEENTRAIRFYEKNGFVTFDQHVFKLGDDEQTDLLMKKTLPA